MSPVYPTNICDQSFLPGSVNACMFTNPFGYAFMNASISSVVGLAANICSVTVAMAFLASGSFSKTPCSRCFSPPPSRAINTFCNTFSSMSG